MKETVYFYRVSVECSHRKQSQESVIKWKWSTAPKVRSPLGREMYPLPLFTAVLTGEPLRTEHNITKRRKIHGTRFSTNLDHSACRIRGRHGRNSEIWRVEICTNSSRTRQWKLSTKKFDISLSTIEKMPNLAVNTEQKNDANPDFQQSKAEEKKSKAEQKSEQHYHFHNCTFNFKEPKQHLIHYTTMKHEFTSKTNRFRNI